MIRTLPVPPHRLLGDWLRINLAAQFAVWCGGILLFHVIDAFENLNDYTRYGAGFAQISMLYALRTPEIAMQILPAALLLGSMMTMFRLARAKELTAAEAAGLHLAWVYAVPLGLALAWTVTTLILETGVLPRSRMQADRFLAVNIEGNMLKTSDPVRWRMYGNALWRIEQPDPELPHYHVERYLRENDTLQIYRYHHVVPANGAWTIGRIESLRFPPLTLAPAQSAPSLPFLPEELGSERPGAGLPLDQAVDRALRKRRLTGDVSQVELDVHQRLSWALLNLTALAAALPFVPRHGRKASTAVGVLIALLVGVGGWAAVVLGSAYATSTRTVAAFWLPHAVFLLTAVGASIKIRGPQRTTAIASV